MVVVMAAGTYPWTVETSQPIPKREAVAEQGESFMLVLVVLVLVAALGNLWCCGVVWWIHNRYRYGKKERRVAKRNQKS